MSVPAVFAVGPLLLGNPAGFPVVSTPKFDRDPIEDLVDLVKPISVRGEPVGKEVEDFCRALIHPIELWHNPFDLAWQNSVHWFPVNVHSARRMNVSVAKVLAILGNFEKSEEYVDAQHIEWGKHVVDHDHRLSVGEAEEVVQLYTEVPQSSFPFAGTFVPSSELVSIWAESLKDLAVAGGRKNVEMALASASAPERSQQFASLFRSTIGSFAQYLRYEGGDQNLLSGGRIAPSFQLAVSDQFHLIPDQAARFFNILAGDFVGALRSGWNVEGDWGNLKLLPNDAVTITLKPIEFFDDPDFVESEDVE